MQKGERLLHDRVIGPEFRAQESLVRAPSLTETVEQLHSRARTIKGPIDSAPLIFAA
jgi:hypothetical protein